MTDARGSDPPGRAAACACCSGSCSRATTSTSSRCTSRPTPTAAPPSSPPSWPTEALTGAKAGPVNVPAPPPRSRRRQSSIRFGADVPGYLVEDAGPRRSAVITEGRRVSFATYFNAFPASYWRRWTTVDSVTLRIRLAGESTLVLYRSTAAGLQPSGRDDRRRVGPAGVDRAHAAAGPVHRRRLVLVRHRGRARRDHADRGGLARARTERAARPAGSASASPRSTGPISWSSSCAGSARRRETHGLLDTRLRHRPGQRPGHATSRASPTRPRSSATGCR